MSPSSAVMKRKKQANSCTTCLSPYTDLDPSLLPCESPPLLTQSVLWLANTSLHHVIALCHLSTTLASSTRSGHPGASTVPKSSALAHSVGFNPEPCCQWPQEQRPAPRVVESNSGLRCQSAANSRLPTRGHASPSCHSLHIVSLSSRKHNM